MDNANRCSNHQFLPQLRYVSQFHEHRLLTNLITVNNKIIHMVCFIKLSINTHQMSFALINSTNTYELHVVFVYSQKTLVNK